MLACVQSSIERPPQAAASERLAGDLQTFVSYVLKTCGRDFFQAVGELELSFSQVRALHVLAAEDEDASMRELADRLGLSLPAVSRALDGLVRRGLVARWEDAADRRVKHVAVTGEGRALLDRLTRLRLGGLSGFVAELPARDRDRLERALAPIVARDEVAAHRAPPSPASPRSPS